jgi:hypothetical protein
MMVLPGLQVNIVSGQPSPEQLLILETWATKETDNCWRLDKPKAISAIEKGHTIDTLRTFLQSNDAQPLPETVEGFLALCQKQGAALKPAGTVMLIDCISEEVAKTLAEHKETAKLCQRVGKKQLLVKLNQQEKFRRAIRIVGFGMSL